jgi:predicted short-subunit dehydrogenase-like oxidoreductase (DUF2520 family)
MTKVKTVNIIGCGNVGKTLARLWTERRVLKVQSVLNRSLASAQRAVDFVGSGQAVDDYAQMPRADLVMISASDESIEECCRGLCRSDVLEPGVVVFHCSGSLPSSLLEPARSAGALIASVHPVNSFPDPAAAAEAFAGTFCAVEGDPDACQVLRDVMERCGAIPFSIRPEQKTIYHAATVFVCNYMVALMEVGLRCFERAGVPRETAIEVIEPIARCTLDNVFQIGPAHALTGPIARGESSVVARQCDALGKWDKTIQDIYKTLGQVTVDLAAAQANATPATLAAIKETCTS